MSTSLTATKIKDTYGQLLHIDGGITSTLKTVYDGDGTATGLKISTTGIDPTSVTLTSGTANGVAYLNGSKVLTTGSALTFDGATQVITAANAAGRGQLSLNGGSGGFSQISFYKGPTTNTDRLGSIYAGDGTPTLLAYDVGNSGYQQWLINSSEQMRLTSTGLGIGTSSPAYKLDVNGAVRASGDGSAVGFYLTASAIRQNTTGGLYIDANASGSAGGIYFRDSSSYTTRLTIDSSGNLGLGVTPSAWSGFAAFQVGNAAFWSPSNQARIYANAYFNGGDKYIASDYASNLRLSGGGFEFYTAPSGTAGNAISFTQAMTLNASGGLSLGTTLDPGAGNIIIDANKKLFGNGTSGSYYSSIELYNGSTGNINLTAGYANASITFSTSGATERMRIDSSGNVGIGTSSPFSKLSVEQTGGNLITARYNASNARGGIYVGGASGATFLGSNLTYSSGNVFNYDTTGMAWYVGAPAGQSYFSIGVASGTAGTSAGTDSNTNGRLFITTSGNVGIGTSSPSYQLEVAVGTSGQQAVANFRTADTTASNNAGLLVYATPSSTATSRAVNLIWDADGANASGGDYFYINKAGNSGDVDLYQASNANMTFSTNSTERMRIDSSGNLLVGTTSLIQGSEKAAINFSSNIGPGLVLSDSTIQNGATFVGFFASTTRIGAIVSNGTTNVAYNTSSDYRLKENIQPMQNALGVVAQLNPVTYTWKADGSDGQGFIAHELQAVVPDCVTGEKDAVDAEGKPIYQGIDTSFLVATLTKAIQEQQEQINQLKAEVAALKGV